MMNDTPLPGPPPRECGLRGSFFAVAGGFIGFPQRLGVTAPLLQTELKYVCSFPYSVWVFGSLHSGEEGHLICDGVS